jgi:hypothetical protein
VGVDEKRESKSLGGVSEEAKRKDDSSKMAYRETNRWFMVRLRHRYPLYSEYPQNMHRQEQGASLWGAVAEVFG